MENIKALSVGKIGNEFVLHIPSEYDYRYASENLRDKIIYHILKGVRLRTQGKLPIYYRDELNLAIFAMTKDDKKKYGVREMKGKFVLHDDESFKRFLDEWEE